jgi:hypothetical protein
MFSFIQKVYAFSVPLSSTSHLARKNSSTVEINFLRPILIQYLKKTRVIITICHCQSSIIFEDKPPCGIPL